MKVFKFLFFRCFLVFEQKKRNLRIFFRYSEFLVDARLESADERKYLGLSFLLSSEIFENFLTTDASECARGYDGMFFYESLFTFLINVLSKYKKKLNLKLKSFKTSCSGLPSLKFSEFYLRQFSKSWISGFFFSQKYRHIGKHFLLLIYRWFGVEFIIIMLLK